MGYVFMLSMNIVGLHRAQLWSPSRDLSWPCEHVLRGFIYSSPHGMTFIINFALTLTVDSSACLVAWIACTRSGRIAQSYGKGGIHARIGRSILFWRQ